MAPIPNIMKSRGTYVRRELAGVAFQLCTVGGVTLGLLRALDHRPTRAAPCAGSGKCVADGVMSGIVPILVPCLVGAVLGLVVGYTIGKLIRKAGIGRRRVRGADGGRWITARYRGRCEGCGSQVIPGERVFHSPQRRKITCPACMYN